MFVIVPFSEVQNDFVSKHKDGRVLVKYDKSTMGHVVADCYPCFRSLVFGKNKQLCCFSPPRSVKYDEFVAAHDAASCVVEEFIDGTMVNLFYDEEWVLSTKTNIGAGNRFFQGAPSFRDLFNETLRANSLNYDDFDKNISYSFVLQHPKNRIVAPVASPVLYLVAAYVIDVNSDGKHTVLPLDVHTMSLPPSVLVPNVYKFDDYKMVSFVDKTWAFKGYMFKSGTDRTKLMNDSYKQVEKLRGNQPKTKYQYIVLRQNPDMLQLCLEYYPELKTDFDEYSQEIDNFTKTLFKNYHECFVKRTSPLKAFPYKYRKHMYVMHGLYLKDKVYRSLPLVAKYVAEMPPALLMHTLNLKNEEEKPQPAIPDVD